MYVRLAGANEVGPDNRKAVYSVGGATRSQVLESGRFGGVMGDDQLPAASERHAVGFAEFVQHPRTGYAVPGLQGVGRVVDSGMNDLAVPGARAGARTPFAFEQADAVSARGNRPRRRQSHDAAADDRSVDCFH